MRHELTQFKAEAAFSILQPLRGIRCFTASISVGCVPSAELSSVDEDRVATAFQPGSTCYVSQIDLVRASEPESRQYMQPVYMPEGLPGDFDLTRYPRSACG